MELGTSIQKNGQVNIKIPALKFIEIIAPEGLQGGHNYATAKVHQAHPIMSIYQNGAGRARMSRTFNSAMFKEFASGSFTNSPQGMIL